MCLLIEYDPTVLCSSITFLLSKMKLFVAVSALLMAVASAAPVPDTQDGQVAESMQDMQGQVEQSGGKVSSQEHTLNGTIWNPRVRTNIPRL